MYTVCFSDLYLFLPFANAQGFPFTITNLNLQATVNSFNRFPKYNQHCLDFNQEKIAQNVFCFFSSFSF